MKEESVSFPSRAEAAPSPARLLAPICAMVFAEFLAMGLPLPVLPARVHDALGLGAFFVGLVIGASSIATLLTRPSAGARADREGPGRAVLVGLAISTAAGLFYALSTQLPATVPSLAALLLGRALLGLGESLVVTGALAWGVALVGRERSGLVMAWVGIAMYGALAVGAPLGAALDGHIGFVGVSLAAASAPIVGALASRFATRVAPTGGVRLPFSEVAARIALPGAGLALAALGFGAIAAFAGLLFEARHWPHAPLTMSAFGAAYVLARVLFGGLPDRFGGARVAAASAAAVALGQFGLFAASDWRAAALASALTGFGFSLAFPSFGVEAVRRVPPQSRGAALGAYAACFDLTMGVAVPMVGGLVGTLGYEAAFAVGALAALGALGIALFLARRPATA